MSESLLEYYRRKSISTEHGVDAEWDKHLARRSKLYRQLGIPLLTFRGSSVLEAGPGEGHNTLPLLNEWDAAHIDLLEPSETARRELSEKFKKNGIPGDKYTVHAEALDEYKSEKKYDILIAEGFLHCLDNWKENLALLDNFAHKNSIIVVTCTDEISFYVEKMKRAVLHYLVRDVARHEEKIEILKEIMKPQLSLLRGMSRSVEDWIEDQIFYPMGTELMTIGKAIEFYEGRYDVLGASQNIFVDYSWFKDFEYDYISSYKKQYHQKKNMFLLAGDDCEVCRTEEENMRLEKAVLRANMAARKVEENEGDDEGGVAEEWVQAIQNVSNQTVNSVIKEFNEELLIIIQKIMKKEDIEWEKYQTYMECFGKTMQYICFVKR